MHHDHVENCGQGDVAARSCQLLIGRSRHVSSTRARVRAGQRDDAQDEGGPIRPPSGMRGWQQARDARRQVIVGASAARRRWLPVVRWRGLNSTSRTGCIAPMRQWHLSNGDRSDWQRTLFGARALRHRRPSTKMAAHAPLHYTRGDCPVVLRGVSNDDKNHRHGYDVHGHDKGGALCASSRRHKGVHYPWGMRHPSRRQECRIPGLCKHQRL
jgi:hypothetical protein